MALGHTPNLPMDDTEKYVAETEPLHAMLHADQWLLWRTPSRWGGSDRWGGGDW